MYLIVIKCIQFLQGCIGIYDMHCKVPKFQWPSHLFHSQLRNVGSRRLSVDDEEGPDTPILPKSYCEVAGRRRGTRGWSSKSRTAAGRQIFRELSLLLRPEKAPNKRNNTWGHNPVPSTSHHQGWHIFYVRPVWLVLWYWKHFIGSPGWSD